MTQNNFLQYLLKKEPSKVHPEEITFPFYLIIKRD